MALCGLVFGLWCLARSRFLVINWRNLVTLVVAGGIILLLSAWYWLPMLEQVYSADLVVFSMDQRLRLEDTVSNSPITCLFLPRRWATLMKHGEAYNDPMGEAAAKVFPITARMAVSQTRIEVDETSPRTITFQHFYYSGYQAVVANVPFPVEESEEGTITVRLPEGANGVVEVKYVGTWVQRVANGISLGALLMLGVGGVVWLWHRRRSRGRIAIQS